MNSFDLFGPLDLQKSLGVGGCVCVCVCVCRILVFHFKKALIFMNTNLVTCTFFFQEHPRKKRHVLGMLSPIISDFDLEIASKVSVGRFF